MHKITYATMSGDQMEDLHRELDRAIEDVRGSFGRSYPLVIDGRDVRALAEFEDRSPIDTRMLLGRFQTASREQVRDAVRRTTDNALDHFLVAMLWQVPGYSVDEAVTFLRSLGRLSDAGQALGRLLGDGDASPEHAGLAAQFWERSIHGGTVETLAGFGWYAEISALDDITWARLTRQTLTITRGRIDWARNVAGRAARPQPTPDTLEILNQLLRGLPDGWDQRSVLETATLAIKKANRRQTETPEYQRLRTTLLERGVDLASPGLRQDAELPADPDEEPDQGH